VSNAPVAAAAGQPAPSIGDGLVALTKLCQQLERPELVERLTAAGARLKRPSTIVCVVGEFKQGKSSLVNGLLGAEVCPVDDDLATSAITLVRFGDTQSATVRRRADANALSAGAGASAPSSTVAEAVDVAELIHWVSERGNPGNAKGVERVDITTPSSILKQGLILVDTPGMGGLGAGHAAATLAFLPFADGVVLVSDVSAELSAPELAFLRRAQELCPTVLFAQTKIDLYPSWQKIVDRNAAHLRQAGLDIDIVAVSSSLRGEAMGRKDRALNTSSRFPDLIGALGSKVIEPAKATAAQRSAHDAQAIVSVLRAGLTDEASVLANPESLKDLLAELEAAKTQLEFLRGPGAKWSQVMSDRVSDVSSRVNFDFRAAMRVVNRVVDERLEQLTKADEWDELATALQRDVADQVAAAFAAIETGREHIRSEVAELIRDERLLPVTSNRTSPWFDVDQLWRAKPLEEQGAAAKKGFQTGLTGLRGAQGGVMMFGMMGGFLPTAATIFMASNPVLLGAGALFGGMQLAEDRKRKVTTRRQSAKAQVRQFLDDVQFDVGNELTTAIRDLQRELRDEFSERLAELQKTYADTAKRAQEDVQRGQGDRTARLESVKKALASLTAIEAVVKQ
jgi:hypothetical protein